MGLVHSLCDESRIRFPLTADEKMVSCKERFVHARELFSRSERGPDARDHWSISGDSPQPIAVDPEVTEDQGD